MARSKVTKVVVHSDASDALLNSEAVAEMLADMASAIEAACNTDSSWGGYASAVETSGDRPVGRVWSIGRHDDEARRQRLIRNLDAGI